MKKLFILFALFVSVQSFAQIETDTHVFWQPGAKLTFDMFQGNLPDSVSMKKMTDMSYYFEISKGFWAALDIPKSKRGWKNGMVEKYYFCAAMDKKNSFFIVRDSTELKYAQLVFDICELSTRISRRNLDQFVASINEDIDKPVNGAILIQYMTCLNDGKQFGKEATHALYVNVIGTHNEAEYQKFRSMIDDLLEELESYATSEEEIRRLISEKPDKGYKLAPSYLDDYKKRGTIRY